MKYFDKNDKSPVDKQRDTVDVVVFLQWLCWVWDIYQKYIVLHYSQERDMYFTYWYDCKWNYKLIDYTSDVMYWSYIEEISKKQSKKIGR